METKFNHQLSLSRLQTFCGIENSHLQYIEKYFNVEIASLDQFFLIEGDHDNINKTISLFQSIIKTIETDKNLTLTKVKQLIIQPFFDEKEQKIITHTYHGKQIVAKTNNQAKLISVFEKKDMVFAVGPAGCGKTFLAVAYGVKLYREQQIKKIILVRPAVEAGESLGFLPGDLKEKVDPYLQPLYDSLYTLLGQETVEKLIEKGVILISPLAYMRGRTLDDALVILDEAQNTTKAQMKMFLTRMGFNSKMIITGDQTQIDLKNKHDSGLMDAIDRLKPLHDIGFVYLNETDIVRHPLVSLIIKQYNMV